MKLAEVEGDCYEHGSNLTTNYELFYGYSAHGATEQNIRNGVMPCLLFLSLCFHSILFVHSRDRKMYQILNCRFSRVNLIIIFVVVIW